MLYCPNCGRENEDGADFCEECGCKIDDGMQSVSGGVLPIIILENRYKVLNIIKSGAMGAVYRAEDVKLESIVAIKKMFNNASDPDEQKKAEEMFKREAKILVTLHHSGLPKVSDYFIAPDENGVVSHFLVMTLVEGEDLESILKWKPAPRPLSEVMDIFTQILEILDYLHTRTPSVVYRDLKPSNVMISDGRVFLVDFGIAKSMEPGKTGTMMGTAGYASPDQIRGKDMPSNDIYSLGVLIHYLLTGLNPEDSSRTMFVFEPVKNFNPAVPDRIADLISAMVDIASVNRPDSARRIIDIIKNGSIPAQPAAQTTQYIPPPVHPAVSMGIPPKGPQPQGGKTPKKNRFLGCLKGCLFFLIALAILSVGIYYVANNKPVETELLNAASRGDIETIRKCLEKGAKLTTADDDGRTPLHLAAYNGQLKAVEFLIKKGSDANEKTNEGKTPLHLAAYNGHKDVAAYLLEKGANLNAKSINGETPIDLADLRGHKKTADFLRAKGAFPKVNQDEFFKAAERGDLEKVRAGVFRGLDVNSRDSKNMTPLHFAALSGNVKTAEFLVSHGALIDPQNNDGYTPLHAAASKGKTEMVDYLISKGASTESKSIEGLTALHVASEGGFTDTVSELISMKANINAKTIEDVTPLHFAAFRGFADTVKLLINKGANFRAQDKRGLTPLNYAEKEEKTDIVQILLKLTQKDDIAEVKKIAVSIYKALPKGDTQTILEFFRSDIKQRLEEQGGPESLGDTGSLIIISNMIKDRKAEILFKDLSPTLIEINNGRAQVLISGKAAVTIKAEGTSAEDQVVEDTVTLEKENGIWKVVEIVGKK